MFWKKPVVWVEAKPCERYRRMTVCPACGFGENVSNAVKFSCERHRLEFTCTGCGCHYFVPVPKEGGWRVTAEERWDARLEFLDECEGGHCHCCGITSNELRALNAAAQAARKDAFREAAQWCDERARKFAKAMDETKDRPPRMMYVSGKYADIGHEFEYAASHFRALAASDGTGE